MTGRYKRRQEGCVRGFFRRCRWFLKDVVIADINAAMGSLFRSEEVTLAQLFLQSEAAYATVRELGELGELGGVQFRDLNPEVSAFQRKFINEVLRCDEMERRLRFLSTELEKAGIEPRPAGNVEAPDPQKMIDLESKFEVLEVELQEINSNKETLRRNLLDLIELQHILKKTQVFFQEAEAQSMRPGRERRLRARDAESDKRGLLADSDPEAGAAQAKFTFVTGVIAREKVPAFERILWRACRGNVFLRQADIEHPLDDPVTGDQVQKVVFILFFQGDQLRTRVRKICEGFRATLYQCPETSGEREQMTVAVSNRIRDLESVLHTTEQHSLTQLQEVALDIDSWETKVRKMKAIYHAMNMFNLDVTQRCLIAECWCPVKDIPEVQAALARGTERSGATVPSILNRMSTSDQPPTFFRTNKFTSGFQAIVDSYGIATYQEVSPVPYTIITFPFLFAVMFGDAGHGTLMALFAGLLILFEKRLANTDVGGEMFSTIFHGRYIVFFMGLFSIYTGMIYNDMFSKSLNLFGSSWDPGYPYGFGDEGQPPHVNNIEACQGSEGVLIGDGEDQMSEFPAAAMEYQTPYPFGLDPMWQVAGNKLVFTNSYKMKLSVVLGVAQMFFGVILSIFNHVHAKSYISVAVEFIPQVLFLLCIFGWLVFLIVVKWTTFYENPSTAPSLLITLINMFLDFTRLPSDYVVEGRDADENEYSVFGPSVQLATLQAIIQKGLVIVAVASVPVMLFVKPFYLKFQHKKKANPDEETRQTHVPEQVGGEGGEVVHAGTQNGKVGEKQEGHGQGEQFEFGEVFIHQAIHTIEYCLGTISNTASYLRLWALSLAHAELTEVLWMMVFQMGLSMGAEQPALGAAALFFLFAFWAVLTIGILLIMEGLSAFLHALRLHWVEFQSKFYIGAGYKFVPFSLDKNTMDNEPIDDKA